MEPTALLLALMGALIRRIPGLEGLAQRYGATLLGTSHKSTLSYGLRRPTFLALAQALLARLEQSCQPGPGELVALDSMPLTLTASRRHGCRLLNAQTAGGGVLWEYWLDAPPGACPLHILRLIGGAWHDTQSVADAPLRPGGPIYLMDIGFWAIDLVRRWLEQGVHFILRANPQDFCFQTEQLRSRPRTLAGGLELKLDAIATLGGPRRRSRPRVRLVWAGLPERKKELILLSDQLDWSAERILAAYKRRGEIEQFHRALKELIGLAHLYSFQELGVMLMLHLAVLVAVLLLLADTQRDGGVLARLRGALAQARQGLSMEPGLWRRNMLATHANHGSKGKRRRSQGDNQTVDASKHDNH